MNKQFVPSQIIRGVINFPFVRQLRADCSASSDIHPQIKMADRQAYNMPMERSYASAHVKYVNEHSLRQHPLQHKLRSETLGKAPAAFMMGAPEVHQFCSAFIQSVNAMKCLDIGTFTGASALAWALAIAKGGVVHTMDISATNYERFGKPIIDADPELKAKVKQHVEPATKTLSSLLAAGESGTFDFAFIDADKTNYPVYYEKCIELLRPGGLIAVDNALGYGQLGTIDMSTSNHNDMSDLSAIHQLNIRMHEDDRVNNSFLTLGDGLHLAFKK